MSQKKHLRSVKTQAPFKQPPAHSKKTKTSKTHPTQPHLNPSHGLTPEEKEKWQQLVDTIADKSQDLWKIYAEKSLSTQPAGGATVFMPWVMTDTLFKGFAKLLETPEVLFASHQQLLQDHASLNQHFMGTATQEKNLKNENQGAPSPDLIQPAPNDKRFKHVEWQQNPYFNYIKQSYLLNSQWLEQLTANIEGLDHKTAQKVSFYTKQWLDALAPTNFLMTNPEAIEKTLETKGGNLLQGFANFLCDLERGKGRLNIPNTNLSFFKIGGNIATTPGKVVFRNDMIELIQYHPLRPTAYEIPMLIIPPWINKFYVFDLHQNSFVQYALDQGHTVFIISWVNPDEKYAHKTFDDYMKEGPLTALEEVLKRTKAPKANLVGYCLGSILLSCTLGYMAAHRDTRAASATFLATLVDFSDPGEMTVFIDDNQLNALEKRMSEKGYLDSHTMTESFRLLRANSLIWNAYINNYFLTKEFAPFDMLFWNADSTRMPPQVHSFYLRNLYQKNLLVTNGKLHLDDTPINLKAVTTPCYFVSTIDDHIAPWHCGFAGMNAYGGPAEFILAGSGHVAGIFNAPAQNKYHYWRQEKPVSKKGVKKPDQWLKNATRHEGSWWPAWFQWLQGISGNQKPAPVPEQKTPKEKMLGDAPGTYVHVSDIPLVEITTRNDR